MTPVGAEATMRQCGKPLLRDARRTRAWPVLVMCVLVLATLGLLLRGKARPDGPDSVVDTAMVTTQMPLRTDFPLTTDPFKYRLMELVGVYGDALRERCNELFGDGILSAIDCVVKLEKKGERGVLTIDAKFLHYKEF